MSKFILAKKIEMSQIWKENKVIPVTLVEAGPCFVTEIKKQDDNGFSAIQIGFEKLKEKKIKKTNKTRPYRYLKEFKVKEFELKIGDIINTEAFEEGDNVIVTGISKGKGFQGGVKRWGFHGFGKGHGVKHGERRIGSIGSAYPQRVIKGRKMPGRMGVDRITVKNLEIIQINKEKNQIAIKGAIPGRRGTLLEIRG
ncbi:MAG: 50S ribosomal protein L3 [Patescibacteria group bacterium]|nr:50S ribosomal protein L3 [Patescibacteria group bacterium]